MGTNKKELVNERDKLLEKRDIMDFWLDGREKEIKSLLEEIDSLRKKRDIKIKIQSEEKLKKPKIKRMFALWGSFAGCLVTLAFAGHFGMYSLLYTFFCACAMSVSAVLFAYFCVRYNIFEVKEVAKLSLAEIDEKIRELEEALQLQEGKKNNAMMELETIHQALGKIDQRIRAADFGAIYQELAAFDGRVSTPQNGMDDLIQDDLELSNLEQADTRQDDLGNVGLDQNDTKENGMSLTRTYKEKK